MPGNPKPKRSCGTARALWRLRGWGWGGLMAAYVRGGWVNTLAQRHSGLLCNAHCDLRLPMPECTVRTQGGLTCSSGRSVHMLPHLGSLLTYSSSGVQTNFTRCERASNVPVSRAQGPLLLHPAFSPRAAARRHLNSCQPTLAIEHRALRACVTCAGAPAPLAAQCTCCGTRATAPLGPHNTPPARRMPAKTPRDVSLQGPRA